RVFVRGKQGGVGRRDDGPVNRVAGGHRTGDRQGDGTRERTLERDRRMSERTRSSQIVISDRESGFPFSKGLLASQVMVTGLSPYRAYQVAEEVELRLLERRRASVTSAELAEVAIEVIGEVAGERYATNFVRWRAIENLDVPLVILIGGATGVGKSTIA